MKVAFVVFNKGTDTYGVRLLTSILRKEGHDVSLNFPFELGDYADELFQDVDENKLSKLVDVIDGSDIVLFSLLTSYYIKQAYYYTKAIKEKLAIPVVWGGSHCIADPEGSFGQHDIICPGEADICLPEFLKSYEKTKKIPTDVPGMWVRKGDKEFKTGMPEIYENLDEVPFPDCSYTNNFEWDSKAGNFIDMDVQDANLKKTHIYTTMTRGCVYKCTFCLHSTMNFGMKGIRKHSVDYMMREFEYLSEQFPNLRNIGLADSDLYLLPKRFLFDFINQYKTRVNKPFYFSVSPATWKDDVSEAFFNSGLVTSVWIGIQGASDKMKKYYGRNMDKNDKIVHISKQLREYYKKHGSESFYHMIWDSKVEEEEDYIENVKLMNQMRQPFELRNHSLSVLPGTEIFESEVGHSERAILKSGTEEDILKTVAFYTDQYSGGDAGTVRTELTSYYVSLANICSLITIPEKILDYLFENHKYKLIRKLEKTLYSSNRRIGLLSKATYLFFNRPDDLKRIIQGRIKNFKRRKFGKNQILTTYPDPNRLP